MLSIFKNNKSLENILFVIGSGRSGTHLLGRTIGELDCFDAFIEDERTFDFVTQVAVNPNRTNEDLKKVIKLYDKIFKNSKKNYVLEKTHPNIWLVEELRKHFIKAKFIGIKRNVYATVASMLNHNGILNWYDVLPLNESNPFLGITEKNKESFSKLPIESKCALRWKSHVDRLVYLQDKFPKEVLVIDYEDFYLNYEELMNKLSSFLGLGTTIKTEKLNTDGLDKWKITLSEEQIRNIDIVLAENYD